MNVRKQCDSVNDASVTRVCCFCSFTFSTVRLSASALMLWFILTAAAERKNKTQKRKIHCLIPRHQGTDQVSDIVLNREVLSAVSIFLILKYWE